MQFRTQFGARKRKKRFSLFLPLTFRKMTLLTPAPMLFFASHRKWPCASFVIFLKSNDPLPLSKMFGSYKSSLYSPGVEPIAFPIHAHTFARVHEHKNIQTKLGPLTRSDSNSSWRSSRWTHYRQPRNLDVLKNTYAMWRPVSDSRPLDNAVKYLRQLEHLNLLAGESI